MLVSPFITAVKNAPLAVLSDVVFNQTDFQVGTGGANLEGPLSLSIDITNTSTNPLYFGVEILTTDGAISISDRANIAFVPARIDVGQPQRRLIGPSSVPQLAYITGVIQKITVHIYAFTATPQATVQLRIGPPVPVLSAAPYIGQDSIAINPGFLLPMNGVIAVGAGAANILILEALPLYPFRYRVKTVQIWSQGTAGIFARVEIIATNGVYTRVYRIDSVAGVSAYDLYYPDIIIPSGGGIRVRADNGAGVAIVVEASFLIEVLV